MVQGVIPKFEHVEAAGVDGGIRYCNFGLLPNAGSVHQTKRPSREVMPHFGVELEAAAA
jgi:hypothetical protein